MTDRDWKKSGIPAVFTAAFATDDWRRRWWQALRNYGIYAICAAGIAVLLVLLFRLLAK